MSRKLSEYSDLPDLSGNQIWDKHSAVRLKIKMKYIKDTYGNDEKVHFVWKDMTPEECMLCGQMATLQEDVENMKNKSIEESAKDNNGIAMLLLALDYLSNGDRVSAMEWAQRAEMNLVFGVYGFEGFLHLTSDEEGETHLERAKECFELSVSAADPISMRYLGYMYKFGVGVEKDIRMSEDLLKCAIAIGDDESKKILELEEKK